MGENRMHEQIKALKILRQEFGDDKIVVMAGIPFNTPGSTNILRVSHV